MSVTPNGSVDVALEEFGGLVTELTPADIPMGASPSCQDVEFQLGAVFTRAGLTANFAASLNPTAKVNYLKTFTLPNTNDRLLTLDSLGNLWYEDTTNAPGALNAIGAVVPGAYCVSTTQFGREYMAFSDSIWGLDIPRQYDGTFFDRVSQDGPATAPGAGDENVAQNVLGSPNGAFSQTSGTLASPNGLSEVGFVVTVTLSGIGASSTLLRPGDAIQISGAGVAGYNGTFNVATVNPNGLGFTYVNTVSGLATSGGATAIFPVVQYVWAAPSTVPFIDQQILNTSGMGVAGYNTNGQTVRANTQPGAFGYGGYAVGAASVFVFLGSGAFGLGASGGGTVTNAGLVTAGVHKLCTIYLTRDGYLTAPSPIASWTAGGGKRVTVTTIAIGPQRVTARWIAFTASGGGFFFIVPVPTIGSTTGTVVTDNSSITATFDFSDATLLAAFSIDSTGNNLFNLVSLAPAAGVISYSNRMFWWGELKKVQNLLNMGFDGGFPYNGAQFQTPFGWSNDPATGGRTGTFGSGVEGTQGEALEITGDGATAIPGRVVQSAYQDQFGQAILQPGVGYSVRVRLKASSGAVMSGNIKIDLQSTSKGFTSAPLSVPASQVSAAFPVWQSYSAPILLATQFPSTIPPDLVLRVYMDGTPNAPTQIGIDEIEVFPTASPYQSTQLRCSYVNNPESFDGVTGLIGVSQFDGQSIRSCFVLRDNLYVVRDSSIFVTTDNGQTEPFGWTVSTISRKVGCVSARAVAVAEDYAFLVNQLGVYMTNGGEPVRINQEIKPVSALGQGWDSINWQYGNTIWCEVDLSQRRLLIGAPTGAATTPNQIFVMNYRELDESYAIAANKAVHMSYTGRMVAWDMSRKWGQWNISANCAAIVRRQNLSLQVWLGNGTGTGKAYYLDPTNKTDDGAAILSQYWTFFFVNREMEQGIRMDNGRPIGSHRHLYTYLAAFTSGSGNLSLTAVADSLTSTRSKPIAPRTLSNNPSYDLEAGVNFTADRASIKFATDGQAGSNFFLSKLALTMRDDPWAPVRGRV